MGSQIFLFKQFTIQQDRCAMKVGTDGILLGAWAEVANAQTVLDIGTGSGLIALMLAQRKQTAIIDAVELDAAAAQQAYDNVKASPWPERVNVLHTAVQAYATQSQKRYDLIVCNPPFWKPDSIWPADTSREVARHTTTLEHHDLLTAVTHLLADNGRFYCILPVHSGLELIAQAKMIDLFCHERIEVKPIPTKPVHRLLLTLGWGERPCQTGQLVIENGRRHDYSKEFIALTKNFYLDF